MSPRPIIFDCDPGIDDAVALLMAFAHPEEFKFLGVTTVAGNVPIYHTARNALKICELAGRPDVPVFAGCSRPLVKSLLTVEEIHGKTGLDGSDLPEPTTSVQKQHAIDFIVDALMTATRKVTLIITGPQTNIAMALIKEPRIALNIEEIIFMGGSLAESNVTPSAEFNIYVDPYAAHVVLTSGIKTTMIGLDITHQLVATPARMDAIQAIGNKQALTVFDTLSFSGIYDIKRYGFGGGLVHDAAVVAYLLKPTLFEGRHVHVEIELGGHLTLGRTIVDWHRLADKPANTTVLRTVNTEGFFHLLETCLKRYDTLLDVLPKAV